MPERGRLIELQQPLPGERDVTLYVKGFLSRGEDAPPPRGFHRALRWVHQTGCPGGAL